jgi:pimeloyl-ACP methyl ester carboxylesterase
VEACADECVILLHGLMRGDGSMEKMQEKLSEAGYKVHNIDYESTQYTVQELAEQVIPEALDACGDSRPVHFVTHSMGGILLRQYLADNDIDQLGRSVMLGPPNQGSEIIDHYGNFPFFVRIGGPAGMQLGTGDDSLPRSLGPVDFELGVIAGNKSINPILSTTLPDKDDGKVSVESTRVQGMSDHIVMPVNHMFMMRDKDVISQVIHYLQDGQFLR